MCCLRNFPQAGGAHTAGHMAAEQGSHGALVFSPRPKVLSFSELFPQAGDSPSETPKVCMALQIRIGRLRSTCIDSPRAFGTYQRPTHPLGKRVKTHRMLLESVRLSQFKGYVALLSSVPTVWRHGPLAGRRVAVACLHLGVAASSLWPADLWYVVSVQAVNASAAFSPTAQVGADGARKRTSRGQEKGAWRNKGGWGGKVRKDGGG